MQKKIKIIFFLGASVFLLGIVLRVRHLEAEEVSPVKYNQQAGECDPAEKDCTPCKGNINPNLFHQQFGCQARHICINYQTAKSVVGTCLKLLEGEENSENNICIKGSRWKGFMTLENPEIRGLEPDKKNILFYDDKISCAPGYQCVDTDSAVADASPIGGKQCMPKTEAASLSSQGLECQLEEKDEQGKLCVGFFMDSKDSEKRYKRCNTKATKAKGCWEGRVCTFPSSGPPQADEKHDKGGMRPVGRGCAPLGKNECIPGTENCTGTTAEGACAGWKHAQGTKKNYYMHGCLTSADGKKRSLCIKAGKESGGCTEEMIDFSSYKSIQDAGVYYNKEGEPFLCKGDIEPDIQTKKEMQTYVVINPKQCEVENNLDGLQKGKQVKWDSDSSSYKVGNKFIQKEDITSLLKSQCIGPLADGCKGKSWWQKALTNTFGNIILTILSVVFGAFYLLFGLLLSLILAVLGWVLSVFDVSAAEGLDTFWAYLRDLSNLLFIIILLYIAFAMVLKLKVGQLRKMLPGFFLGAVLINFSKQIALIIVDLGDFLIQTFLKMLPQDWDSKWGLASAIAEAAGVKKWFSADLIFNKDFKDMAPILGGILFGMFFQFIFLLVIGLATLLLVLRIVILWFLIVLSPLPYAAMAAGLKGWSKKWWDTFLKTVFFAPAMIFCLVLAVVLLTGTGALGFKQGSELEGEFNQVSSSLGSKVAEAAPLEAAGMEGFMRLIFASAFVMFGLSAAKMGSNAVTQGLIGGVEKLISKGKQLAWKGTKETGKASAWPIREGARTAATGLGRAWRENITRRNPIRYAQVQAQHAKEVGEMETKIKSLNTKQLKKISRGKFGLERTKYTPQERQRLRAAASHLLAERNQLPDYNAMTNQDDIKKYITRLERWGGSRDKILENRPDWAGAFADNPTDPVQRRTKIREVLDKKSPKEMWRKVSDKAIQNEDIQRMLKFNDYQNIAQDKQMSKKRKRELLSAIGNNLHKIKNVNRSTARKIGEDILRRAGVNFQNVRTVNYDAAQRKVVISYIDPATGRPADYSLPSQVVI